MASRCFEVVGIHYSLVEASTRHGAGWRYSFAAKPGVEGRCQRRLLESRWPRVVRAPAIPLHSAQSSVPVRAAARPDLAAHLRFAVAESLDVSLVKKNPIWRTGEKDALLRSRDAVEHSVEHSIVKKGRSPSLRTQTPAGANHE